MRDDFIDYGLFDESEIDILGGKSKLKGDRRIVISTWQSAIKQDEAWFARFGMLNTDECFDGDTLISTPEGFKKIKDFKPGDAVYSTNEETGEIVEDRVVKLHENLVKSNSELMYELTMSNGSTIKVTGNHQFMTTNRGWVRADELTEEDDIVDNL